MKGQRFKDTEDVQKKSESGAGSYSEKGVSYVYSIVAALLG